MNTGNFLQSILVLHLIGLTIMAGTTVVDFTTFKTFWKQFYEDKEKSMGLLMATSKFSRLTGIGAALLVVTGIGMMALTNGIFGEQLWFRIKIGIVVALMLNGLFFGRRLGIKLRKTLSADAPYLTAQINRIRVNLNIFFTLQFILFFCIVFLSVFKFN